jgi:uncharacterized oxidoreductase
MPWTVLPSIFGTDTKEVRMKLVDKTIVLTGGSSGIGLELARVLAKRNRLIVLASRPDLDARMREVNPSIHAVGCDLAQGPDIAAAVRTLLATYQHIDILINNAAVQFLPRFTDEGFDAASIEREIGINLTAPCCLIAGLLPALLKPDRSFIMNVNSGLALAPKTSSAVYCASKAALAAFSLSLGYQLETTNVRVLQAFLPLVDTPMTKGRGAGKLSPLEAAEGILEGLARERPVTDLGKVRWLRLLLRLAPSFAHALMKKA